MDSGKTRHDCTVSRRISGSRFTVIRTKITTENKYVMRLVPNFGKRQMCINIGKKDFGTTRHDQSTVSYRISGSRFTYISKTKLSHSLVRVVPNFSERQTSGQNTHLSLVEMKDCSQSYCQTM